MRRALENDIDLILQIYDEAKTWMRDRGIQQWDQDYPGIANIRNDMKNDEIFVFETNENLYGVASLSSEIEEPYENPVNGRWKGTGPYGTIHRIAVLGEFRGTGISYEMMKEIKEYFEKKEIYRILVDTHVDNHSMKKFLENNGFEYCTEILTERNHPRIGYEYIRNDKKYYLTNNLL